MAKALIIGSQIHGFELFGSFRRGKIVVSSIRGSSVSSSLPKEGIANDNNR